MNSGNQSRSALIKWLNFGHMEKLTVAGRTNWKAGFYIKFKAEEKSMKIIKKIVEGLGSDYFADNQAIPRTFSKYEKWKDMWIPVYSENIKNSDINIICGDKIIHMVVSNLPDPDFVNKILNKYCDWAPVSYKK